MALPSTNPSAERRIFPSDLTRAARRRAQREADKLAGRDPKRERRDSKKNRYLDLAQRMQFIADELTLAEDEDLLRRLNYIINQTRLRGCPPQKQDYERVFEAIRDQQCVCVYDISEETTFPPSVVWGIIDGLVAMGVLRPERGCAERDDYDTRFKVIGPLPSSSPVRP